MKHPDHVALIQKGIAQPGTWADLGSGRGAFTLALAELLGPAGQIYSVDKDSSALREQERKMQAMFPAMPATYIRANFQKGMNLPRLDGILMANSLHFIRRKEPVLAHLLSYLKPGGRFILVEYNSDRGNIWVPHPLSYPTWEKLANKTVLEKTEKIGAYPSRFLGEIFGAMSVK